MLHHVFVKQLKAVLQNGCNIWGEYLFGVDDDILN